MTHPYASAAYSNACATMSEVLPVSALDGWVSLRRIPDCEHFDGAGPYPFCPLEAPVSREALHEALARRGLVSLTLVTDALDDSVDWIEGVFDFVRPYKLHHIIDRQKNLQISKHHRAEIRRANKHCETKIFDLGDRMEEWCAIYRNLESRHHLTGLHRFSDAYFDRLKAVPGLVMIGAFSEGELISAHIWIRHQDQIYSHLAASSEMGYQLGASYSVYDYAIALFSDCRFIDLGGVPDNSANTEGLNRFKRGFANDFRPNWICGHIGHEPTFMELCAQADVRASQRVFFPAYRAPH